MTAPLSPAPALTAEEAARVAVFDAAEEPEEVTVERVARALYEAEQPYRRFMAGPHCHDAYRRLATAALTALRATVADDEMCGNVSRSYAEGLCRCVGPHAEDCPEFVPEPYGGPRDANLFAVDLDVDPEPAALAALRGDRAPLAGQHTTDEETDRG